MEKNPILAKMELDVASIKEELQMFSSSMATIATSIQSAQQNIASLKTGAQFRQEDTIQMQKALYGYFSRNPVPTQCRDARLKEEHLDAINSLAQEYHAHNNRKPLIRIATKPAKIILYIALALLVLESGLIGWHHYRLYHSDIHWAVRAYDAAVSHGAKDPGQDFDWAMQQWREGNKNTVRGKVHDAESASKK